MWCEKCNYGSDTMKVNKNVPKCPQCGHTNFLSKNPFPKNRTTSIHPKKQDNSIPEKVTIVK